MARSGFPDDIEVTLGSGWKGYNGLNTNDVITLTHVDGTDYWTEDGTNTADVNDNRIRIEFSENFTGYLDASLDGSIRIVC